MIDECCAYLNVGIVTFESLLAFLWKFLFIDSGIGADEEILVNVVFFPSWSCEAMKLWLFCLVLCSGAVAGADDADGDDLMDGCGSKCVGALVERLAVMEDRLVQCYPAAGMMSPCGGGAGGQMDLIMQRLAFMQAELNRHRMMIVRLNYQISMAGAAGCEGI